mmetsp:Transcript_66713/g.146260  ORF Transcript_66713/g.146260 Transcript_66713/m.146260 type:complete len:103 (-) Transcript_66713:1494-1802(-)
MPKKVYCSRVSSLKMVPPVFCSRLTPADAKGNQKQAKIRATSPAAIKVLATKVLIFGIPPTEREAGVPYQQIVASGRLEVGDKSADSQVSGFTSRPSVAAKV